MFLAEPWLVSQPGPCYIGANMARKAKKNPAAVALGRLGGRATAARMTPEERKANGRKGALVRIERYHQTPRKTNLDMLAPT